jgi:hypothetical protein
MHHEDLGINSASACVSIMFGMSSQRGLSLQQTWGPGWRSQDQDGQAKRKLLPLKKSKDQEVAVESAFVEPQTKREFEQWRKKFLSTVPTKLKNMFGQIGFASFGKQLLPVLILNPFHVPPHIRKDWIEMYEKVRRLGHSIFYLS